MPTEKRFYLIHAEHYDLADLFSNKSPKELTDAEFVKVCKTDGFNLSCEEMAEMVNDEDIIEYYCRYI